MSNNIIAGKFFNEKHPNKNRDWVVGSFIENQMFRTEHCELKWQRGEKGVFREPKDVLDENTKTLAVLAYGKVRLKFIHADVEHVIENEGDYVIWTPDEPHEFEFLEDSLVITLRWCVE